VVTSQSLAEAIRRLGLLPSGGNYRYISARIRLANLDTSHFRARTTASRCASLTREELEPLVLAATSVAQVLAKLQLPAEGRAHRELTARLRDLGLDTSYFRGKGWSRGETRTTHPSVERVRSHNTRPDSEVFVENSPVAIARRSSAC
jgi:hypothetical protein